MFSSRSIKMRTVIVLSALVAVAFAAILPEKVIPIISLKSEVGSNGEYLSAFETGNGIKAEEHGYLKNAGSENANEEVVGRFEYTAPGGIPIVLEYIANEFGFQPKGAHLPVAPVDTNTSPPIPEYIQRSLIYNEAHPEEDDSKPQQKGPGKY